MNFVPCRVETPRRLHLDCAPGGMKISFTGEGEADVKTVVPATEKLGKGDTVWLSIPKDSIHLFQGELPILWRVPRQGT